MTASTKLYTLWCILFVCTLLKGHAQEGGRNFLQQGTTFFGSDHGLSLQLAESRFFSTNLGWNRALSDKFGLGGEMQFGTDFSDDIDFIISVNGAYAFLIGNHQLITLSQLSYGQVFSNHDIYHAGIKLAYPIQLKESNIFLMPNIGYEYELDARESQDFHTQGAGIGVELYTSIPQGNWFKDQKSKDDRRYPSGTQIWGSTTRLMSNLRRINNKIDDGEEFVNKQRHLSGSADYSYYIFDNFALGTATVGTLATDNPSNNTLPKSTFWSLSFQPYVRWHPLHNGWTNNLFVQGGAGLSTNKSSSDNNALKSKTRTVWALASVGAFVGLAQGVYLTPNIQYHRIIFKNLDSADDAEITSDRLRLAVQLSYVFF